MNVIARFDPKNADIKPVINVPANAPTLFIAPIQLSSSFVIGPVLRGESSDNSNGNEGLNQPITQP